MAVFTHSIKAIKLTERRNIWTHLNEIIYRFLFSPFPLGRAPPRAQSSRAIFCLCHWTLFNFTEFLNLPTIIHGCLDSLRQSKNSPTDDDDDDAKKKTQKCDSAVMLGRRGRKSQWAWKYHRKEQQKKMATKSRAKWKQSLSYRSFRLSCSMCCNKSEFMYLTTWNISLLSPSSFSISLLSISCVLTVCTRLLMMHACPV